MKEEKIKYYRLNNILKEKALINMIIGERSNGKTYAVQEYGLQNYIDTGEQMAIIRRWSDDFTGKRGQETFSGLVKSGAISKMTKGKWDRIKYLASRWYLAKYDKELDKMILDVEPFCFGFSINTGEHDKSTNYDTVTTILFDEFLSRKGYLTNEFIDFMNLVSTIVRDRDNAKVFMCGNTVNKYSPYFKEMGINKITSMKRGTIDIYKFGESKLKVAVEYCLPYGKGKKSDVYFAFDNPKLKMITEGTWEVALYPHLPKKYIDKDILLKYYIIFDRECLQCNIIRIDNEWFTYIHRKTTPIKQPDKDIVFSQEYSTRPNYFRRITEPTLDLTRKIWYFYQIEKVYYQDNEVGEIIRNYIQWSKTDQGIA